MEARDYANRTYLSANEAAQFLGVSVRMVHRLTAEGLSLASPPTRNRRIYRIETRLPFGGKPAIALNLRLLQESSTRSRSCPKDCRSLPSESGQ